MGEEILSFIDPLMGKLLSALQNSPRNLQETCMVRYNLFFVYYFFSHLMKKVDTF